MYIGDVEKQSELLRAQYDVMFTLLNHEKNEDGEVVKKNYDRSPFDLSRANALMEKRAKKHLGQLNKYNPHQGKKECARRVAQIGA